MYKIKVISDFSAAHMLRGYKGKCENVHGHNWKVEVSVSSEELDKSGMVVDFKELKKNVNAVLDGLDHRNLNAMAYFKKANPTSENIAKYIYDKISCLRRRRIRHELRKVGHRRKLSIDSCQLKVTVWESDTACATYSPKRR